LRYGESRRSVVEATALEDTFDVLGSAAALILGPEPKQTKNPLQETVNDNRTLVPKTVIPFPYLCWRGIGLGGYFKKPLSLF